MNRNDQTQQARGVATASGHNGTGGAAEMMKLTTTCDECARVFDLLDADDATEWEAGHDCEVTDVAAAAAHWTTATAGDDGMPWALDLWPNRCTAEHTLAEWDAIAGGW